MDSVELPLPATVVSKHMRSSGCGGGGGVTVELVTSQLESVTTCSSSFHSSKGKTCNVNDSRPSLWNKITDVDHHKQASRLPVLGNEEIIIGRDSGHIQNPLSQAKQSQRKSSKASRSSGKSSRRSRVAHMEASFNLTGSLDVNASPIESGSYPGKSNIPEKMKIARQKTVSLKRSEKRNAKLLKSKCDSFSVKAGLSSFSSAACGNNIFRVCGSKQDIYDVVKQVDELSLNELLNGTYKHPDPIRNNGKTRENLNEKILHSVRDAFLILQLHKSKLQKLPKSDDAKGDTIDPSSSCNKVEDLCSNIPEIPLFAPKDVVGRLSLSPPKDLDLLLQDTMKPTSTLKNNVEPRLGKPVHSRGGLPTFPWSHGAHSKTNPDVVRLTTNKSICQGRWVKIVNSAFSFGDTTTCLADLESLVYDQSLVPLSSCQHGTSKLPVVTDATSEKGERTYDGVVLAAAETLCEIATCYRKQNQLATKFKSNEQLEKALFMNSKHMGPTDSEGRRHEYGALKRPFTTKLSNKAPKLRKLVPMEWRTPTNKNR